MKAIGRQYVLAWSFFRRRLLIPALIVMLFFLLVCVGIAALLTQTGIGLESLTEMFGQIAELFDGKNIVDENGNISAIMLIYNNLTATALTALAGMVPFVFVSGWVLLFNAAIIGVLSGVVLALGSSASMLLGGLIPHGIFEIPALCIAGAIGIYLCLSVCRCILRKPGDGIGTCVISSLRVYITMVIPLIVIAGFVESYVTPLFMA